MAGKKDVLRDKFEEFVQIFDDLDIVSHPEAYILKEIFEQGIDFYDDKDRFDIPVKEHAQALLHHTVDFLKKKHQVNGLTGELVEQVLRFPRLMLRYSPIKRSASAFDDFTGLGMFEQTEGDMIAATRGFALFPLLLARLSYPEATVVFLLKKSQGQISPPVEARIARAQSAFQKATHLAKRVTELASELTRLLPEEHPFLITPLKDQNIYEIGSCLYHRKAGSAFIFSKTPGIVIPGEYNEGATPERDLRKKYFDEGLLNPSIHKLPRYYQWNAKTTSKALWQGFKQAEQNGDHTYRARAADRLSQVFQVQGLEISEADFDLEEEGCGMKQMFTVMTGWGVAISNRDTATAKIVSAELDQGLCLNSFMNGLAERFGDKAALRPRWKIGAHDAPSNFGELVHRRIYEAGMVRIIKRKDEFLDRQMAAEWVSELLARGEQEDKQNQP